MDLIALEDLALLEVLRRIDQCLPLEPGDTEIRKRLIESGLVTTDADQSRLTAAGIELCKSLQHRAAADKHANRIVEQREADAEGHLVGTDGAPLSNGDSDGRGRL